MKKFLFWCYVSQGIVVIALSARHILQKPGLFVNGFTVFIRVTDCQLCLSIWFYKKPYIKVPNHWRQGLILDDISAVERYKGIIAQYSRILFSLLFGCIRHRTLAQRVSLFGLIALCVLWCNIKSTPYFRRKDDRTSFANCVSSRMGEDRDIKGGPHHAKIKPVPESGSLTVLRALF